MILNTGSRTDIPAFYSAWFFNRVRAGEALMRNPYRKDELVRYSLSPDVVDVLVFCTKNPEPMLSRLQEIKAYRQFWGVTITPYGEDIEPGVPSPKDVVESVKQLSGIVGKDAVAWRYDPVLFYGRYGLDFHLRAFSELCRELSGYVSFAVVSFIDLYQKTVRNFPEARKPDSHEEDILTAEFVRTARRYGLAVRLCCERPELSAYGADVSGCLTKEVLEKAAGISLSVPRSKSKARPVCACLLGADIGAYNSCPHGCRYCYANYDKALAKANYLRHDPGSPLLIGWPGPGDHIRDASQESWLSQQLELF